MLWSTRLIGSALIVMGSLALAGCFPSSQSSLDEEREPHFLAGRARVSSMDYKGAMEAFEKALEVNPRSASAHLELGLLCEKDETDCAAAIYHFDRFLELRPDAENAAVIKSHILACKQELAKTVSLGPVTQSMQRQFDQLAEENRRLRDEVEKWRAYYNSRSNTPTSPPAGQWPPSQPPSNRTATVAGAGPSALPGSDQTGAGTASRPTGGSAVSTRTYKVQPGDTPASIARRNGIKVEALMAANPGLNPTRLQIGQTVNVPAQ